MSQNSGTTRRPGTHRFTEKQGQYLAFIHAYTRVLGRPPAEADLQRHFHVTPPSVHQMVLTLERAGNRNLPQKHQCGSPLTSRNGRARTHNRRAVVKSRIARSHCPVFM